MNGMTDYQYHSLSGRTGILLLAFSCLAIICASVFLRDAMGANLYKSFVALAVLTGGIGADIVKMNYLNQKRTRTRQRFESTIPAGLQQGRN